MSNDSPCIRCGACCATFRVSFYWAEADDDNPAAVPAAMTEKLNSHMICMQGTNSPTPRCSALLGDIGDSVRCTIYERRSSACREFAPAWENNTPNEACDRARIRWGLPPLTPNQAGGSDNPSDHIPPKAA